MTTLRYNLHLFSGLDSSTIFTDAVELTPESSGEVTLPSILETQDPGFNWFHQWVTGNGASPQPGQDPPEEEMSPEDDRLILPTEPTSSTTEGIQPSPTEGNTEQAGGGDYCALSASHTMCQFKVTERSGWIFNPIILTCRAPPLCVPARQSHQEWLRRRRMLFSPSTTICGESINRENQGSISKFALLLGWPRVRRLVSLVQATWESLSGTRSLRQ